MTRFPPTTDPLSIAPPADQSPARFRPVLIVLCGLVALVAVLDLIGWRLQRPGLVGALSNAATMKPNTALCVLLLAAAVVCRQAGRRAAWVGDLLGGVLAGCALALSLATLLEYWSGHNFGIDQLLARVPFEPMGDPAGRMSQGTAIDGALSALALLAIDLLPVLGSILSGIAGLLSLSALVGFLFDAGPLLGVPVLRSMALRTALAFTVLQVAWFLLRPHNEPTRSMLRSARHHRMGGWLIAGSCLLPLLVGWPVAVLYRRGLVEGGFAFAMLVVALMAAQTWLVTRNSISLAQVEQRRELLEEARQRLIRKNEQQHEFLVLSEQRAAQSEALYRLISDALPALVSYLDPDLRYRRVNRSYEVWFGVSAADAEGRTLEEVVGVSAPNVRSQLLAALTGTPQQFDSRLQTLQGERTVSASYIPDVDAAGSVRGVIVHVTDITAARQAQDALRLTEKLAAVGKLASSIAHEINNPLESVTNLLYLARTTPDLAEARDFLATAEQELARVSAIATQTLRFHKQSTRPTAVQARELFDTVLAIYRPRLTGAIRLEERHRPAAPLVCMEGEIRQVLNNLVGNALDAMHAGPGRLLVRTRAATSMQTGQQGLLFTVADTGSGMSAATLAVIFEAFFTTKGINGTGLGLWVSKEIIDRHRGLLHVRSSQAAQPSGTVFRLFLPYAGPLI